MSIIENLLDDAGVDPEEVASEGARDSINGSVGRSSEIDVGNVPPPTDFPENPFLDDAQTGKGGLFANLGDEALVSLDEGTKMSEFPLGSGKPFGLDGKFMQPVYVNTTDESISIEVDSVGFGPTGLSLNVGAYNETKFAGSNQWTRIPTGIGTPYPLNPPETAWNEDGNFQGGPILGGPDGDYELVEVSETGDGFKVVWKYLGTGTQSVGETVTQPPEEDAEAYI